VGWHCHDTQGSADYEAAANQHADQFVLTTRTWSNSVYFDALDSTRDDDHRMSRDAVVDELFARYAAEVAAAPADHAMDYVHAFAVIEKV
jgi:hypothetical protein